MRHAEKLELAQIGAQQARPRASGWYRGPCPFPDCAGKRDQTFSIQIETGHFHCFRCHTAGSIGEVEELIEKAEVAKTEMEKLAEEARKPPDGFLELGRGDGATALCCAPARKYLTKRGIAPETVLRAGIGCVLAGRYANRIVAPVKVGGEWRGWIARDFTGKAERKYMNARGPWRGDLVYNAAGLAVETDEPFLIVEGVFDALPFGADAGALLGKPTESQIALIAMEARRPVVVVLDGDAWEEGWALAMRLRLDGVRAGSVRLPAKLDPDQVSVEWARNQARLSLEE